MTRGFTFSPQGAGNQALNPARLCPSRSLTRCDCARLSSSAAVSSAADERRALARMFSSNDAPRVKVLSLHSRCLRCLLKNVCLLRAVHARAVDSQLLTARTTFNQPCLQGSRAKHLARIPALSSHTLSSLPDLSKIQIDLMNSLLRAFAQRAAPSSLCSSDPFPSGQDIRRKSQTNHNSSALADALKHQAPFLSCSASCFVWATRHRSLTSCDTHLHNTSTNYNGSTQTQTDKLVQTSKSRARCR